MLEIPFEISCNNNHKYLNFLFRSSKNPRPREGKICAERCHFVLYVSCILQSNGLCLLICLNDISSVDPLP